MRTEQKQLDYINKECNTNYKSMDEVDWAKISYGVKLTENFIREFANKVTWGYISECQTLSESFIREFSDKVSWWWISQNQTLSENFIREFKDNVNWGHISRSQKFSADFIREFKDSVNWDYISHYQQLSEDFIREFKDKLNWLCISSNQKLSEDFIREFSDKVNWAYISAYRKLSEDFIREFKDKVAWWCISRYQKLSKSFIREFKDRLYIHLIEDNWNYKDTEFLKQQVIDTGLYECHKNYFIAYKGIRRDRHSAYNFQYQYITGETYEAWCDCSSGENSFGLSVWTKEKACEYCNQLVVKVKVNYKDVGRVVHNGGKIRCKKITILD